MLSRLLLSVTQTPAPTPAQASLWSDVKSYDHVLSAVRLHTDTRLVVTSDTEPPLLTVSSNPVVLNRSGLGG